MLRTILPALAVTAMAASLGAQEPPRAERPPRPVPAPTPAPVPPPAPADAIERLRLELDRVRSLDLSELEFHARDLQWELQHDLQWELQHDLQWELQHDLQWELQHELAPRVEDLRWQLDQHRLEYELAPRLQDLEWRFERDFEIAPMFIEPMHLEPPHIEPPHIEPLHIEAPYVDAPYIQSPDIEPMSLALERWRAPFAIELPESPYPQDPADSLYRSAREMLNRGEYRRAAQTFRQISERFATSKYAQDALYYEAFALYRIGTVADMRGALTLLERQRERFPRSETDREAASLAMRIRGELAANGDARAASEIEGMAGGSRPSPVPPRGAPPRGSAIGQTTAPTPPSRGATRPQSAQQQAACDRDAMAVKLEALSALSRIESPEVTPALRGVLQRRDECSASLRRRAVLLLGQQAGAETGDVLIDVAKNDPDDAVRREAINMLARIQTDAAVTALQEIVHAGDSRLSAAAMRALNANANPRARQAVRALLERNDVAESIRLAALESFRRATPDEAAYLRGVYPKLESRRLRSQAISTISRLGGAENDQWLMALARNDAEAMELRAEAVSRLAATAPIAEVARLYDQASDRRLKERIIVRLASREEPEAVDKLIAIARSDADHELRREAIERLSRKRDPRTTQLLLEIIGR